MKLVELHGQTIPIKDDINTLKEAMHTPLTEIKVEGETIPEDAQPQRID